MDYPFRDCDPTSTGQQQQQDAHMLYEQHLSLAARRKARKRFMDVLYARNRRLREKEEEIDLKRKVKQITEANTIVKNENNALQSILDSAKRHIETTMNDTEKKWLETMVQRVTASTEVIHTSDPTTDGKNKHSLMQDEPSRLESCNTSTNFSHNPRLETKMPPSSMQNRAVKRRRSGTSSNSVQSSKKVRDRATTGAATIARVDAIETSLMRPFHIGNCINNSSSMTLNTFSSSDVLSNNKSDGKNEHVLPMHPSNCGATANHNTNIDSSSNVLEMVRPSTNFDTSTNNLEIIKRLLDGTRQQFSTISTNTSVQSPPLTTTSSAINGSSTSDYIVAGLLHAQHHNTQQHEAERNEALRRSAYAINYAQQQLNQDALHSLEQQKRLKLLLSLYGGGGSTINSNTLSTQTISNNLSIPQQPIPREGISLTQSLASLLESLTSTANQNTNRTASQSFSHTPNTSDDFAVLATNLLLDASQNKSINDNPLFSNYPISTGLESPSPSTNSRFSNDLDTFSSQSSNILEAYLRLSNNTNLRQSNSSTQIPQYVQQHLPSAYQNLSNTDFAVPQQPPNMLESYFKLLSNTSNPRVPMLTQSRNYNQQHQHQQLPQQQHHSTNLLLHPQQQQLYPAPTPNGSVQQDEQHLAQKQLLLQELMQILRY